MLIAGALAGEWVLAFAFAKRFANAIADAYYEDAFAYNEPPRLRTVEKELIRTQERLTVLEQGHPGLTMDDWGRQHTKAHD